jgi:hypothetical protein
LKTGKKARKVEKLRADERTQNLVQVSLMFLEEIAEKPVFAEWLRDSETFKSLLLKVVSQQSRKLEAALQNAFACEDERLRLTAAQLLGINCSPVAIRFLIEQSSRNEPAIRYDALMGLCKALPHPQAVEVIWKARGDADPIIREGVASAISGLPLPTLEKIAQVRQKIARVRTAAARKPARSPGTSKAKQLTINELYRDGLRINRLRARPSIRERPDRDELYPK